MMHGVSFKDYSDSFVKVTGGKTVIPATALTKEDIALRQASEEAKQEMRKQAQIHQVADIIRKVNDFIFLTCLCGLVMKIPPNYKHDKVTCPRCKRILDVPAPTLR
jgi:heat shock protein HtpX